MIPEICPVTNDNSACMFTTEFVSGSIQLLPTFSSPCSTVIKSVIACVLFPMTESLQGCQAVFFLVFLP